MTTMAWRPVLGEIGPEDVEPLTSALNMLFDAVEVTGDEDRVRGTTLIGADDDGKVVSSVTIFKFEHHLLAVLVDDPQDPQSFEVRVCAVAELPEDAVVLGDQALVRKDAYPPTAHRGPLP